ncbi:MIP/aquaporin family protein [Streptomyces sp. NPDC002514]|uniref:MIP/aquaporin family protein n=1 Tax=Streptomyces sp. NPDC001270 TaxID=3364554 RepID=UPI0036AB4F0F
MSLAPGPNGSPDRTAPATALTWRTVARGSASECLLATVLLFGVTTIVRWVAGPSPVSATIPGIHQELLVIGACVGVLLALLILSPAGKASGGHINPAISLAMWRFGLFPGAAVVPYSVAQLAGSLLGTLAGRAVWGPALGRPPVSDAALQPGPGWSAGALFAGEATSMGIIVLLVGVFLAVPGLVPLVPWLVGLLIGAAIALLGTTTGGSVNPARQFGPALAAGRLDFLWVYLLAPLVGAFVAAAFRNALVRRRSGRPRRGGAEPGDAARPRARHRRPDASATPPPADGPRAGVRRRTEFTAPERHPADPGPAVTSRRPFQDPCCRRRCPGPTSSPCPRG